MSDPDLAAESADAAQGADADSSPHPWGDNFDAERAWKTISHLRGREKELESDAKAWKRLQEDDNALQEFLAERGLEFADDTEPDDDEFDVEDTTDIPAALQKRLDDIESWRTQQEQQAAMKAFDEHINTLAKTAELELSPFERRSILAASIEGGFNPKATEAAFKELSDYRSSFEKKVIESYGQSKKAPNTPPQPGRAGEQSFDPTDRKARRARFASIAEAQAD